MTSGEQLTLLPAESLASLSVWPGSRQAQQMTVTSGRRLLASLPSCDRELWWLKTLVASSAWHSTMCLLTWKHKATPAGRSYYQLQASVPRIDGTEFGLLPTMTAAEAAHPGRTVVKEGQQVHLSIAARMWMTPKARDADFGTPSTSGRSREMSTHLATQVAHREGLLPTPRAIYGEHPGMTDPRRLTGAAMLPTPRAEGFDAGAHRGKPDSLHSYVKMLPTPRAARAGRECKANHGDLEQEVAKELPAAGMKLNPAWVSRMQGFPDNWMELD